VAERELANALAEKVLERLGGAAGSEFAADFWSLSDGGDEGETSTRHRKRAKPAKSETKEKVLKIIAVNAHGWPSGESKGLGLWLWQAYMNHANPREANCACVFIGEVLLMRALKKITAEEECVHSYCPPSASFSVRSAILRHCGVPLDPAFSRTQRFWEGKDEGSGALGASLALARTMTEEATRALHEDNRRKACELWTKVLSLHASDHENRREDDTECAPALAELLRLQLRAARCLGDMPAAAAVHASLAVALSDEQPLHVEVLAHWLGYLRAGGKQKTAMHALNEVRRLSRFWLGKAASLAEASEWMESCGLGPRRL
ncbi:unnamed protein product, partial [Symbiodinium pilosum]